MLNRRFYRPAIAAGVLVLFMTVRQSFAAYDPLTLPADTLRAPIELTVHDDTRKRDIPIRVYLPADKTAAPVVLFSHGLGGTREAAPYLGKQWAARGYVAVFMQHPGSDDSVWKDRDPADRMDAMRDAANVDNFLARVKDVSAVIDAITTMNQATDGPLANRLDLGHIAMAGHSFGGITTQAVSGETFRAGGSLTDKRIKAAIVLSPSPPTLGDPKSAFGSVTLPWLLITGTNDVAPIGGQTAQTRKQVYPALPAGDKFQVVLDGATHASLVEGRGKGDGGVDQAHISSAIAALSTAFLDAYLKDDAQAKAWITGDGAKSVLKPGDEWSTK